MLSGRSESAVPPHVPLVPEKSVDLLGHLVLLDEFLMPHLLWILCKDRLYVCLSGAGFCNIFTEWDGGFHRVIRCWPEFLGLWLWHRFSPSWYGPFHQGSPARCYANSSSNRGRTTNCLLVASATYLCLLAKGTEVKVINSIIACQKDALDIQIVFLGILYYVNVSWGKCSSNSYIK